jgi:hypothetical protein
MKKVLVIVLAAVMLVGSFAVIFAEESTKGKEATKYQGRMHPCQPGMRPGPCGMCGPMMHQMMPRTLIETKDGNFIVMVGNKLMKYDKDLNLVKEAEIKIDAEAMKKMMMEMREGCPKHKMFMEESGAAEKGAGSSPEGATKP